MEEGESGEVKMEQQAEMQSLALAMRQYQAQAEAASQELIMVQQAIGEHEKAIETITQLKKLKQGDELIVPIGANSSIYVSLSAVDKVLVMIGGGVSAEKDQDSSALYLKGRKEELEKTHREMAVILQKIEQEAQKVQGRLQELAAGPDGQTQM